MISVKDGSMTFQFLSNVAEPQKEGESTGLLLKPNQLALRI